MIEQYLAQLNDPDPAQRRAAIIALGKAKDPAAMPYLARVFREDAVPELRDLARKAGQYIRQQGGTDGSSATAPAKASPPIRPAIGSLSSTGNERSSSIRRIAEGAGTAAAAGAYAAGNDSAYEDDDDDGEGADGEAADEYKGPIRGRKYTVSADKVKSGHTFTQAALDMQLRGENDKAMKNLATALSLNPNLVNDQYFMNIAASLTGLEGDGAVRMIVDANQRKSYIKEKVNEKKKAKVDAHMSVAGESSWGTVGFEALMFLIVSVVGLVLMVLVTAEMSRNAFGNLDTGSLSPADALALRELDDQFSVSGLQLGLPLIALGGLVGGIFNVIGTAIQGVFIHLTARVLGGRGTFVHMLTNVLRFITRYILVTFVLSGILIVVTFVTFGSPIVLCAALPLILYQFYFFFKYASVIGESYDFGVGMGCVTVFLASLALFLLGVGISLLGGQAVVNTLAPFIEGGGV